MLNALNHSWFSHLPLCRWGNPNERLIDEGYFDAVPPFHLMNLQNWMVLDTSVALANRPSIGSPNDCGQALWAFIGQLLGYILSKFLLRDEINYGSCWSSNPIA